VDGVVAGGEEGAWGSGQWLVVREHDRRGPEQSGGAGFHQVRAGAQGHVVVAAGDGWRGVAGVQIGEACLHGGPHGGVVD